MVKESQAKIKGKVHIAYNYRYANQNNSEILLYTNEKSNIKI